jgi:hypothetical protein
MVIQALILPGLGIKKINRPCCAVQKAIHSFRKDFGVLKCVIIGKTRPSLCRNMLIAREKCRIF